MHYIYCSKFSLQGIRQYGSILIFLWYIYDRGPSYIMEKISVPRENKGNWLKKKENKEGDTYPKKANASRKSTAISNLFTGVLLSINV